MDRVIVNSSAYYRNVLPQLVIFEQNNDNAEIETLQKPCPSVTFKKKNVSQMGRRKANRAQNGTHILVYAHVFTNKITHVL